MRRTIAASAFLIALALTGWAATRAPGAALLSFSKLARAAEPAAALARVLGGAAAGAAPDSPRAQPAGRRTARVPASGGSAVRAPADVSFREVSGRGLLVKTWINGAGPYDFAVDTGAGATIISQRVAAEARVGVVAGRTVEIGGLSGVRGSAREASLRSVALGDASNLLPGRGHAVVTGSLPPDIDGVLDPTETYHPLGYTIDFPNGNLRAFDSRTAPLRRGDAPPDGAVVPWLTDGGTRRPFVTLEGGRRALLDTGSGFGLAVTPEAARALGVLPGAGRGREIDVRDLGEGRVGARRISPATVRVGSLVLRGVPTDLLAGAHSGAPVLLGRDALRPFEITFDPVSRLIRLAPR